MTKLRLMLSDGREVFVKEGTKLREVEEKYYSDSRYKIMAFKVNYDLEDLNFELRDSFNIIEPVDLSDKDGVRIYQRSLSYLFARSAKELYRGCDTIVEHSLSGGLFCRVHREEGQLTRKELAEIEARMREIVERDEEFIEEIIPTEEAKRIFAEAGLMDKARLLDYRKEPEIKVYKFGEMTDYYYGYMLPSCGKLDVFELKYYDGGLILRHPTVYSKGELPEFVEQKKLAKVHKEAEAWGKILGLDYVAKLNELIEQGDLVSKILTVEALHNKKIVEIAEQITKLKRRIILIAGPSSSGKTTFANRLKIQLSVNGLRPITISVDDYFVDRPLTPRDETGNYDFESIDAIDREKFNEDLLALLAGKKVSLPLFDFVEGRRRDEHKELQLSEEQPLIIEGIHCLNPLLTASVSDEVKFKIYISCLTQLNIDEHNRIPTTDTRLVRRLVRDMKHRGNDALATLRLWPSVRRGEERNIFPYQESADAIFNSATVYELAVLKRHVEPMLKKVPKNVPEIAEANRLLKFLKYFLNFRDEEAIPNTAIIREFIGGSIFHR